MQYFAAFTLILFWTVNKLQCSDRANNTAHHIVKLVVTPKPVEGVGNRPIVLGKKAEPLNLTCQIVYQKPERNDIPFSDETPLPIYVVDWKVFLPNDNRNPIYAGTRYNRGQSVNSAWLWFEKLTEADGGDYSCQAISRDAVRQYSIMTEIRLSVRNKVGTCGSKWFRCHSSRCIRERYLCDGMDDCPDGEDETEVAGCDPDPCTGKVFCGERCLPPAWCCDLGNCNTSFPASRPDPPGISSTEQQRFNDIGFLQTTIYTVIGCAMAFMFIVTILVIMICRVHMKRALNSRCPQQIRTPGPRPRHSIPLYDLDVYLNRAADINNQGGVTVTYNINNGVQFVGRPVEPPPYSEVTPVPPREGPPPPYVSQENLLDSPITSNLNSNTALQVNSRSLTTQFINNDSTTARVTSAYQNNPSSSSVQCFTSGQTPGPQATPGFNRFNMSLTCDDTSNTTLNTSDSTALNSSSNSDSSSTDSVSNFAICRNITSHSQNFEPEYTETDSLLTENNREIQVQNIEQQNSRSFENSNSLLQGQRTNGIQDTTETLKNTISSDVPLLQSECIEDQSSREPSSNLILKMNQKPQVLKIIDKKSHFLEIGTSADSKCSQSVKSKNDDSIKNSISAGLNSLCNQDSESTLQRLNSKTILDLSLVGESSDNSLSNSNIETARSLPFYLNLNNPLQNSVESDINLGDQRSNLVINRDLVNQDSINIGNPISSSDPPKYAKVSGSRNDSSNETKNASSSRGENIIQRVRDSSSLESENAERFPTYLDVKDDQILRVPLVAVGDNSVSYNNILSNSNITENNLSVNGGKLHSDNDVQVRETQPLVMPLRESFIGLRKED